MCAHEPRNTGNTTLQILSPFGSVPFDPNNQAMTGWADETNLDVQTIHAIAPGASIVVLTSPVNETVGTMGLPQFLLRHRLVDR